MMIMMIDQAPEFGIFYPKFLFSTLFAQNLHNLNTFVSILCLSKRTTNSRFPIWNAPSAALGLNTQHKVESLLGL